MKHQCNNCGKPASIHFKKTVNGKTAEYYLCTECAESGKYNDEIKPLFSSDIFGDPFFGDPFFGDDFFKPFGIFGDLFPKALAVCEDEKCSLCGKHISEIKKDGIFGCSECYKKFGERAGLKKLMPKAFGEHKNSIGGKSKEAEASANNSAKANANKEPSANINAEANANKEANAVRENMQSKGEKIKNLRAELKSEVEKENYERAAFLRDEIRRLEA